MYDKIYMYGYIGMYGEICMARNGAGGSLRIFEAPPVPAILLAIFGFGPP